MKKYTILLAFLISLLTSVIIFCQTLPQKINYQGVLKDASGVVVANGDYNLTFKLYNTNSGGTALWTETKSLNVTDGIINTQLGSVTPVNLPFDVKYWLGVSIGAGTELTPRLELSSVPYSYMSMNVPNGTLTAEKIASGQVVKSINSMKDNVNILAGSNVTITPSGNNLTISTTGSGSLTLPFEGEVTTPNTKGITVIHSATTGTNTGLYGQLNSTLGSAVTGIVNSTTGATRGIFGENHSSTGFGVQGVTISTSGINHGVYGRSYSTDGFGVYGFASRTTGTNYGVHGISSSTSGIGVYGLAEATSTLENYGVFGESNSTLGQGVRGLSPNIGVYGRGEGTTGLNYGIYGRSQSVEGYGVWGTSPNIGVYGISSSTSGIYDGVYGKSNSPTGHGVYGTAPTVGMQGTATGTSGENYGVLGVSNSLSGEGTGVWGVSARNGVVGVTTSQTSGVGSAIYGISASYGWSGYFNSHVRIVGELHNGMISFKLDHPLDPENKYLNHSGVESSEMKNIYDGTVELDAKGEATIILPDWFEAFNKDFRYQLTCIGGYANVYISEKVNNNQFRISGGSPGLEVSWQITGIRKDSYSQYKSMEVEEDKKIEHRGKYLHPEAFGKTRAESIDELNMLKSIENVKKFTEPRIEESKIDTEKDLKGMENQK